MNNVQQPTYEEIVSYSGEKILRAKHPAFAQIEVNRIQVSGSIKQYGSEFSHANLIEIKINRSECDASLSGTQYQDKENYITVSMTESQWATLISSLNAGGGVPCTLLRNNGDPVPELPPIKNRNNQFASTLNKEMEDTFNAIDDMYEQVDGLGLSKKKADELKRNIGKVKHKLEGNIPFIANKFDKHMESTVETAKQEIHGYMTHTMCESGKSSMPSEDVFFPSVGDKHNENESVK